MTQTKSLSYAELVELERAAEAEFARVPGFLGACAAHKVVAGKSVEELAVRVYLRHKRPREAVPPAELIPAQFRGLPTDVMEIADGELLGTRSVEVVSPLVSGIHIHLGRAHVFVEPSGLAAEVSLTVKSGTLGCFAKKRSATDRHETFALTCFHVVSRRAAVRDGTAVRIVEPQSGAPIFHSSAVPVAHYVRGSLTPTSWSARETQVGAIADFAPFGHVTRNGTDYIMDAALVKLAIKICESSNSNCGVSYRNAFRDASNAPVPAITGTDTPTVGQSVWKVGAATGFTRGTVRAVHALAPVLGSEALSRVPSGTTIPPALTTSGRVIEIEGLNEQFADNGDSGSVLMSDQGKALGLIFRKNEAHDPPWAFACHLGPILDELDIDLLSRDTFPREPAGSTARSDVLARFEEELQQRVRALELEFLASQRGREFWELIEAHREEVVRLVNFDRRVTIAWHKLQGPAYINRVIANARDPNVEIPRAIDGVKVGQVLASMSTVLKQRGSPELRQALECHEEQVLARQHLFSNLHELAKALEAEEAAAKEAG